MNWPLGSLALLVLIAPAHAGFSAGDKLIVHGSEKVHLRAEAAAASKSLEEFPPGATGIVASGREHMNGPDKWIEVRVGNKTGWIHSRYVRRAEQKTGDNREIKLSDVEDARDPVAIQFVKAFKAERLGMFEDARHAYQHVLNEEPENALAKDGIKRMERAIADRDWTPEERKFIMLEHNGSLIRVKPDNGTLVLVY